MVQIPYISGKIPSTNYNPSLVCVVARVYLLTLNRKHLLCFGCIFLAESNYGVSVEKKATWGCIFIATLISPSFFIKTVRLNIIMFIFLSIIYMPLSLISKLHLTYYLPP